MMGLRPIHKDAFEVTVEPADPGGVGEGNEREKVGWGDRATASRAAAGKHCGAVVSGAAAQRGTDPGPR